MRVVLHGNRFPETLLEYLADRLLLINEITVTDSAIVIHTAGKVHSIRTDLGYVHIRFPEGIHDFPAHFQHRCFGIDELIREKMIDMDDPAREIGHRNGQR